MSEVERGARFFMSLFSEIMDIMQERKVPFEAIYRLATPNGSATLSKLVDLLHDELLAAHLVREDGPSKPKTEPPVATLARELTMTRAMRSQELDSSLGDSNEKMSAPKLPDDKLFGAMRTLLEKTAVLDQVGEGTVVFDEIPLLAIVEYEQPSFEDLKQRFPAYIHPGLEHRRFDPIPRCKDVPFVSGELAFEYIRMPQTASTDDVLIEMDRRKVRPALFQEALEFVRHYPDEQDRFPIVALGSEAGEGIDRRVICLWRGEEGRYLDLGLARDSWGTGCRFLAVRHE